jgi:transposase InsO family protein
LSRYQEHGLNGLKSHSKRPHTSPNQKITPELEKTILPLRKSRNIGARRIQSELLRNHQIKLGLATIHKVLKSNDVEPIVIYRKKSDYKRYAKLIPGERVQMDTCKIAPGFYQYTSVDDCTRYRVLRLFKRRTAANTAKFVEAVIEEMPFPIQRFQTDRGTEFFAEKVQKLFMKYKIKFRPNKPASPHLNGKVERSQKTDKTEFYATVEVTSDNIHELLAEWQHYYNWERPHSAHNGKSPMEKYFDVSDKTPFSDEIEEYYGLHNERIQLSNYKKDLEIARLKGSL